MKAWLRLAPVALILAVLAAIYLSGGAHYFTLASLRDHERTLEGLVERHPLGALALYMGAYAAVCALCLPFNLILTLAGGLMFGPWIGGAATVFAGGVGSLGAYYAARTAIGAPLLHMAERRGGTLKKAIEGFGRNAFSYVLSLRLIPIFPFWLVSVAAGVASPPIWAFLLGTMLGIIPACFIYAGLGSGLGKAFASGRPVTLDIIFAPHIIWPLVGLAVLSLAPAAAARLRKSP
ncbi:MAG TPA: VTT domain-containing protein [Caulobacteraceae bacterium]|nr:VTT domain-containing protein [Caulobacteraceae bacterium]